MSLFIAVIFVLVSGCTMKFTAEMSTMGAPPEMSTTQTMEVKGDKAVETKKKAEGIE